MNIGLDAKRAFLNFTGLGNYSRDLISGLLKHFPENNYFLFTPKRNVNVRMEILDDFDEQKIITPERQLHRLFKSLWRSFHIPNDIIKGEIEIFHGLSNELPFQISKTGAKSIVSIHDMIFVKYPENYRSIDRKIYFHKAKFACSAADTIVATSEQTKRDIIDIFNVSEEKVTVVYQACNSMFTMDYAESQIVKVRKKYRLPKNFLLSVGTIEKRKNHSVLLRALALLKSDVKLVIVSKRTKYKKVLESEIAKLNINDRVIFLENVDFADLPLMYRAAEIFLYPSFYEGFGIPILEALYSKVPVITNKSGCFPEVGGPGTCYVDVSEPEEVASAIMKIMQDSVFKKQMITSGVEFAKKFTIEEFARCTMEVYKD